MPLLKTGTIQLEGIGLPGFDPNVSGGLGMGRLAHVALKIGERPQIENTRGGRHVGVLFAENKADIVAEGFGNLPGCVSCEVPIVPLIDDIDPLLL